MPSTALITGATSGLGEAAAEALAKKGIKVLIAGRDAARGGAVVARIKANGGDAEFLPADLFSLKGVRQLAAEVKKRASSLSILINNAGGTFRKQHTTPDNLEQTFMLNTLAPFVLTRELTELLSAGQGRVVNVATGVPKGTKVDLKDLSNPTKYSGLSAYSKAKLALIAASIEQSQRLSSKGITVVSIHPGIIMGTRFSNEMPRAMVVIGELFGKIFRFGSTLEQAANRFVFAATGAVENGAFYNQDKKGEPPAQTQDASFRAQLWSDLERLAS